MECCYPAGARICTSGYSLTTFNGEIDATFRKQPADVLYGIHGVPGDSHFLFERVSRCAQAFAARRALAESR